MSRLQSTIDWLEADPEVGHVAEHTRRGLAILVSNLRPDIATDAVLARLDAALALIERYAPDRWRRLHLDLNAILVRRFPCRGAFYHDLRLCLVELTFLAHPDISAAQVAASIVHEGVHAEIAHLGAAGLTPADEERRCRLAEIEFGLALPDGGPVVQRARDALGLADDEVAPTIDWNLARARMAERDRDALS